jgi:hypothetical protein
MKKFMLAALACSLPALVSAGSVGNVTIAEIALDPDYGNLVFVRVSPAPQTRIACSQNGYWHFAFPLDRTMARAIYTAILAAHMAGKTISITGADNCDTWRDVETIRGINVQG